MYQIDHNYQCSCCGLLNVHEIFWRDNQEIIKCKSCGHEKVNSTMTTSCPDEYLVIELPQRFDPINF